MILPRKKGRSKKPLTAKQKAFVKKAYETPHKSIPKLAREAGLPFYSAESALKKVGFNRKKLGLPPVAPRAKVNRIRSKLIWDRNKSLSQIAREEDIERRKVMVINNFFKIRTKDELRSWGKPKPAIKYTRKKSNLKKPFANMTFEEALKASKPELEELAKKAHSANPDTSYAFEDFVQEAVTAFWKKHQSQQVKHQSRCLAAAKSRLKQLAKKAEPRERVISLEENEPNPSESIVERNPSKDEVLAKFEKTLPELRTFRGKGLEILRAVAEEAVSREYSEKPNKRVTDEAIFLGVYPVVAKKFGISRQRVEQVVKKARKSKRLRKMLDELFS